MQQYKIIIPTEIVNASKVDFSKPVYIYWSEMHLLCISNKKRRRYCFGQISVDGEYAFILTQNTIAAILSDSNYKMFIRWGNIYITASTRHYSEREKYDIFTIPKEILQVCNIDFTKRVYLCFDAAANNGYYLSNHQYNYFSLGFIPFSENYSFYLTPNICKSLDISSPEQLSVYSSGNRIYFKPYNNDRY